MFESAELGHAISKQVFEIEEPKMREKLLNVQYELLEKAACSVVLVLGGVDGAGKGEVVNLLHEWMDARHITTHALEAATDEERERPQMYRFWSRLPPRGKMAMFVGSWYTAPIINRVYGNTTAAEFARSLDDITHFEAMLSNERVLVIKIWLHLSKRDQRARFKELAANPKTAWRVTKLDWQHFEIYDRFRKQSERALRATSTGAAPWHVIESTDAQYRSLSVGQIIHDAIRKRLEDPNLNSQIHAPALLEAIDNRTLLGSLDLSKTLDKESYESRLADLQARLNKVARRRSFQKRNVVLVFEGADAAGKGGAIRRITGALDARQYRVTPIAAPTDEERARPYLWRFWRNLPRKGHFAIFDCSWYGRVLVERIEKFCDEDDWMRAYGEINDFEEGLAEAGAIILKFWLHISPEEQLKRFTERQETSFKRFKIGPEDWRNREKADAYRVAGSEMIDRTSTEFAPWTIVEANDKRYARIKVLRTLVERLESELSDS